MLREDDRRVDPGMTKIVELSILRMREEAGLPSDVSQVHGSADEPLADPALGTFLEDDLLAFIGIDSTQVFMTVKIKRQPAIRTANRPMFLGIFS